MKGKLSETTSLKELSGCLNAYVDKPLTDEDIEDAIGEAMFERNFKCCPTYENMTYEEFKKIEWHSEVDKNGKLIITRVDNANKKL